jgi:hypothetical protein
VYSSQFVSVSGLRDLMAAAFLNLYGLRCHGRGESANDATIWASTSLSIHWWDDQVAGIDERYEVTSLRSCSIMRRSW